MRRYLAVRVARAETRAYRRGNGGEEARHRGEERCRGEERNDAEEAWHRGEVRGEVWRRGVRRERSGGNQRSGGDERSDATRSSVDERRSSVDGRSCRRRESRSASRGEVRRRGGVARSAATRGGERRAATTRVSAARLEHGARAAAGAHETASPVCVACLRDAKGILSAPELAVRGPRTIPQGGWSAGALISHRCAATDQADLSTHKRDARTHAR